jgi:hypothetical protein
MTYTPVPDFAADYPEIAETLEQARLPFYCINCYQKRETVYLTPNFGPFCRECVKEMRLAAFAMDARPVSQSWPRSW